MNIDIVLKILVVAPIRKTRSFRFLKMSSSASCSRRRGRTRRRTRRRMRVEEKVLEGLKAPAVTLAARPPCF